jgi:AcrR family transcriptional regulator
MAREAPAAAALTPRQLELATAAREVLETEGAEGFTMRAVADRIGIRAPSLYKHFPDKEALQTAVIATGFEDFAASQERAAARAISEDRAGRLGALAKAYRAFARRHPHLYRLMTEEPLRRDLLPSGLEDRAARPLWEAVGRDQDRARAAWAFAHGMTIIELNDRFPAGADLAGAWAAGIGALAGGRPARQERSH